MTTHLVTTLKRKATEIISEMRKSQEPVLITEYGKPVAYLVDVKTLNDLQEKIKILELIALGERDIKEGRVLTHQVVQDRMKKWLK